MANSVTVTGVTGSLKWAYHEAAVVNSWAVTRTEGVWRLSATIASSHPSRVSQRPLKFVAPHATGVWTWPVTELQISGASLNAVLGPREM